MFTKEFGWFQFDAGASGVKSESAASFLELQAAGRVFGVWVPEPAIRFRNWLFSSQTEVLVLEPNVWYRYQMVGTGTQVQTSVFFWNVWIFERG